VNFHASSNTEYWTVEWKDGKYVVSVFDNSDTKNSKPKETFFMDDMKNLKASFDIDQNHIFFIGNLADPSDPEGHTINTSDDHGKKLSLDEGSGSTTTTHKPGEPLHPGDTPPDPNSVSKGEATWTGGSSNVEIHADPTDGVNTYHVSTTGNLLLHGATPNDKVNVSEVKDGFRTITFTSPDGTTKTFVITCQPDKGPLKIIIDSASDKMSGQGVDNVSLGNSLEAGSAEFKDLMQALEDATGADEEAVLKQIRKFFPQFKNYDSISKGGNGDGKLELSELEKAYQAGEFPPSKPDQNLIMFFYALDGDFQKAVDGITLEPNMAQMRVATAKLVEGLSALYPDVTVRAANPEAVGKDWMLANDILFGDRKFHFTNESDNPPKSIVFQWLN
jgi:hypothetical protein